MNTFFNVTIGLFSPITGGAGGGVTLVPYALAAIFWACFWVIVRNRRYYQGKSGNRFLVLGIVIALGREIFLLFSAALQAYGVIDPSLVILIIPPMEQAVFGVAMVAIADGFLRRSQRGAAGSVFYLNVGTSLLLCCYLVTFWWWGAQVTSHPGAEFSQTWCDWLFRMTIAGLLLYPVVVLVFRKRGLRSGLLAAGLFLVFLHEFLKVFDYLSGWVYTLVFDTVRGGLYLLAIPLFCYVSYREEVERLFLADRGIRRSYQAQSVLNNLLQFSHLDYPLSAILDRYIEILTALPWDELLKKGAILLKEKNQATMTLMAARGMEDVELPGKSLEIEQMPHCRKVLGGEVVFVRAEPSVNEMFLPVAGSGGYYCVPIMSPNRLCLGQLILFTRPGQVDDEGLVGVLRSIGGVLAVIIERKRAEEELKGYRDSLEDQVAIRTAEIGKVNCALEQKILEHKLAVHEARSANEAKSDFLSRMSHEIRTPLNGIAGMINLLSGTVCSPEQQELLRNLRISADRLLRVINDILDFARIEAGKLEVVPRAFQPALVLNETGKMFAALAGDKGVVLTWSVEDRVPRYVISDPDRLRQILINLMGNAIRCTDQGEVVVTLSRMEATEDHHVRNDELGTQVQLLFQVRDTGIGIPEDHHRQIFQTFTQGPGCFDRRGGGSGLGLAIAEQLVTLLGGSIWVESTLGKGATFRFTVMAEEITRAEDLAELDKEDGVTDVIGWSLLRREWVPGKKPLRILLVEDEEINRMYAVSLLNRDGISVAEASDGREAVQLFMDNEYDLVLMDVQMPGMDGFEATGRIRAEEQGRGRSVAVIAMTAHAIKGYREKCLEAGMDGYVTKPIDPGCLLQEIDLVLERNIAMGNGDDTVGDAFVPLDYDLLVERRCRGNTRLAEQLLKNLYEESGPRWLKEAEEAVRSGEGLQQQKVGHAIKGAATMLHANGLAAAGSLLEEAGATKDRDQAEEALGLLKGSFAALVRWGREQGRFPVGSVEGFDLENP